MSVVEIKEDPSTLSLSLISQLFRLGHEQGLTEDKLKHLFNTGVLARVFKSEKIQSVNLEALERVLGIKEPFPEVTRPILVKNHLSIQQLIDQHEIVTYSDRHTEIVVEQSESSSCLQTVLTQLEFPTYGKVKRSEESRGVRSADLRELITFTTMYDQAKIGRSTIVALGTRTRCRNNIERPEVFWTCWDQGRIHLKHNSSYSTFKNECRFLGVLIES